MIGQNSRYAKSILYKSSPGDYLGMRERIDSPPRFDDVFHTVIQGDRVDLLAYHYLGDAKLWWIICDYNDIFFPLELEQKLGKVLRIPSIEYVNMNILD